MAAAVKPGGAGESLRVVVRCRPGSTAEGARSCVQVEPACAQVVLQGSSPAEAARVFTYDAVLGPGCTQEQARCWGLR